MTRTLRIISFVILLALILVEHTFVQAAKPQTASQCAVSLYSDADGIVKIDGVVSGNVKANVTTVFSLSLGEHVVEVASADGNGHFRQVLTLDNTMTMGKFVMVVLKSQTTTTAPSAPAPPAGGPQSSEAANPSVTDWGPWLKSTKVPAVAVRTRCIPESAGGKARLYLMLQNIIGIRMQLVVKNNNDNFVINPNQVVATSPIDAKNCQTLPAVHMKYVWRDEDVIEEAFNLDLKNGRVNETIATDWGGLLGAATNAAGAGIAVARGGNFPPQPSAPSGGGQTGSVDGNQTGGSVAQNSRYVSGMPQCGQQGYDNPQNVHHGQLMFENRCSIGVNVRFTSSGEVWGTVNLSPGEKALAGFSADDVNGVGGIKIFTCPGSSTPVDPGHNPVGSHYKGAYECYTF